MKNGSDTIGFDPDSGRKFAAVVGDAHPPRRMLESSHRCSKWPDLAANGKN